jgi:signal peptidase I
MTASQIVFRVVSDSMHPIIKINDNLIFESVAAKELKIFDIILFKRHQNLVVHFIWRNQIKHNQTIITRSLKSIYLDEEPILATEILGRVTNFKFSKFSKFIIFFKIIFYGKN